jgi:hypothetical protein
LSFHEHRFFISLCVLIKIFQPKRIYSNCLHAFFCGLFNYFYAFRGAIIKDLFNFFIKKLLLNIFQLYDNSCPTLSLGVPKPYHSAPLNSEHSLPLRKLPTRASSLNSWNPLRDWLLILLLFQIMAF